MQLSRFSSCRGGAFVKLVVFLAIFAGVLTAAWIFFMPVILASTLTKRTGFEVKVQRLTFNPFVARVSIEGLVITNPFTFPRPDYVDVRSFQAQAPVKTLWSDRPEFDWVQIDVSHIAFVRNTDGTMNASLFYDRLFPAEKPAEEPVEKDKKSASAGGKTGTKTAAKAASKPGAKPVVAPEPPPARQKKMAFLIRRLELKLDRVTIDDQAARNPSVRQFQLGIDQTFENVTGAKQLMTPAMLRALSPVATIIEALVPGDLGQVLSAAAPESAPQRAAATGADEMKSIVDTLEESRKP